MKRYIRSMLVCMIVLGIAFYSSTVYVYAEEIDAETTSSEISEDDSDTPEDSSGTQEENSGI